MLITPCHFRIVGLRNAQRSVQTASRLKLAYDLHEPLKPRTTPEDAPIIFLHGLFGSKKNNRAMSKALARDLGRYVYAVDLRNHGQSPHDRRHDYLSMAEDVFGFISDRGLQNTTLIGHSMGAKTAMALALQFPGSVADIVAVDNAPIDAFLGSDFASYIRAMKKVEQSHVIKLAEADEILQEVEKVGKIRAMVLGGACLRLTCLQSLAIRQFLLGNLHREPGQNIQTFRIPLDILGAALGHLGDFPFKDPGQVRFEKPALFVRGTRSRYVPDEVLPTLGQFFPKFRLVDIEAGHWLISEQPEEFREAPAVVEFLQKHN
ncbi:alpha/beta fold family hydrolase, putative [Cordyceps militaris CM01]|uniref:Alpha/beta fold family hydrolase, putative n=2 Tax=Cordyceps militaris TaxID=73501 RepID=G3JDA0_CORMM|nr:alpha/beta fold family hydrolase, putative [Cordyceps militaris CM01]EGX92575.1 alpha/beta fold family hydrolase, putative [Cordyceps militaris CM01]